MLLLCFISAFALSRPKERTRISLIRRFTVRSRQKATVPAVRPAVRLRDEPAGAHTPAASGNTRAMPVLQSNVHPQQHGQKAHRPGAQAADAVHAEPAAQLSALSPAAVGRRIFAAARSCLFPPLSHLIPEERFVFQIPFHHPTPPRPPWPSCADHPSLDRPC